MRSKFHILALLIVLISATPLSGLAGTLTEQQEGWSRQRNSESAARQTAAPPQWRRPGPAGPSRSILDAHEADANARAVRTDIQWANSLADAKQRAGANGKLVFWVHMLGKLDGAT